MMTLRVRRGATVAVAAIFLVSAQAPAHAADGYQETVRGIPPGADQGCDIDNLTAISRSAGYTCFYANGDDFLVIDQASDSKSVAVQWKLADGSRSGLIRDKIGARVNTWLDKDFPENAVLKFRMGFCGQSPSNDCRQSTDYSNWGTRDAAGGPQAFCTNTSGSTSGVGFCNWP